VAGGVVVDAQDRVLAIERHVERDGALIHEVRLPKGHIDAGESDEAAALREVLEESGYGHVAILGDLGSYVSEFTHAGQHHVREERYFLMRLTAPERQAPQPTNAEEALFEPFWHPLEVAENRMTYPSEREFIRRARQALATESD